MLLTLLAIALAVGLISFPAGADVTGDQVKRAVRLGVRAILKQQLPDGSWADRSHPGGLTCLATLALLQAGERPDSPRMTAALLHVSSQPNQAVYVTSLKIMVLVAADPVRYRQEIQIAAQWLCSAQDSKTGLWSYRQSGEGFDHSNSQFALLGLHSAAEAGVTIPLNVWQRARNGVLRTQNSDGGWDYRQDGASYGSMTAAGISDLIILGQTRLVRRERGFQNGAAPHCGEYQASRQLTNGLAWLARRFRVEENPGKGLRYVHYWLYTVERCGILSGQRFFGMHDWYREGAEYLVRRQILDGDWSHDIVDTCLAVLFLAKGHKALLVQKLRWARDDEWNPDRHDVEHLVAFIGDKLGEPVTWQVVEFEAPLEEWLAAPILYLHGHQFPRWTPEQRAKLRAYIEAGGLLLAEACCGRQAFVAGFNKFVAETFPEVPLRELSGEHPVYHSFYDLEPSGLTGLDLGCRTSVIFSPRDLSCLWEQADLPRLSEEAFKLGTNIAAYASGRQPLRDRLDVITIPQLEAAADPGPPPGDAFRMAQIIHNGDWRPDPLALVHFAEFLHDELGLDVVTRYRQIRLTDPDLSSCPILYMVGHYDFQLSEAERDALAAHLRRGGFLLAEACCGRVAFDQAFRRILRETFPDQTLEPLPVDHAVFQGKPGFDMQSVRYKEPVLRSEPDLNTPRLWGLTLDGRLCVVYSPYALGCGLDGHVCYGCRGLLDEDARRLTANIVLYALTH
ncbi:MAG: DUF4159 domain-containing protein [Planctomycetes bacterium]|nr:DUF4159 domain-containing protein [Planctomycetota bacterium]